MTDILRYASGILLLSLQLQASSKHWHLVNTLIMHNLHV